MVSAKAVTTAVTSAVVLAATTLGLPAPARLTPRQMAAMQPSQNMDAVIATFAMTLELLEGEFYRQVILQNEKSGMFNEEELQKMQTIFGSEDAHATKLQEVLSAGGGPAIQPCQYNFDLSSRDKVLSTALVLEETGQAAYLGAAGLISSKDTLALAGSILPVESQHACVLRGLQGLSEVPRPFSNALAPNDVSTLVVPFIGSCAAGSNPVELIPPNPQLQMQQPEAQANALGAGGAKFARFSIDAGTGVAAAQAGAPGGAAAAASVNDAKFCAFPDGGITGGARFTDYAEPQGCQIPDDLVAPALVMLTRERNASTVLAGPMPLP